jgi:hypothetical protein
MFAGAGGLNLFWFAGQLAWGSLMNVDDWRCVAWQMGWPWFWRPVGSIIGVGSYVVLIR